MTRGYIILKQGTTIIEVYYSNSDSYPSELGKVVLTGIKKQQLNETLKENVESNRIEVVELPFEKTNYIQTKENEDEFFVDEIPPHTHYFSCGLGGSFFYSENV